MARRDRPSGRGSRGGFGGGLRAAAAVAGLSALSGGCHLLVGFDELPESGAEPLPLLGACTTAEPSGLPEPEIRLGLTFVQNSGPPASRELEVKACALDPPRARLSCATPLTPPVNPDESGRVELLIGPSPDREGPYFSYVRAEKAGLYFPTSILTWPAIRRSAELPPLIAISELLVQAVTELTMLDRVTDIDNRGHLIVVVTDCSGAPTPNVEVLVDERARDETTVTFARGSDTLPDFKRWVTDDDGIVVYLGLPASQEIFELPLQLRDAASGRDVLPEPITVPVRRSEVTMVLVAPWLAL
ncbi:MAG TPA: hypothetical protein VFS43_42780 [Polyangiaceae bacterium]|nr:hypothetical protein [Polyangiaceae bacterium]